MSSPGLVRMRDCEIKRGGDRFLSRLSLGGGTIKSEIGMQRWSADRF
jgi:hypothetical protein